MMNALMGVATVSVALASTPSAAATLVQGRLAGTMRIVVIDGHLNPNPVGIYPEVEPITYLAGATGTITFLTTAYAGVPRDYDPFGVFTPYYTTSFSLKLDDTSLPQSYFGYSGDNYEPNPGEVYHKTGYFGNAQSGSSYGFYSVNNGYSTGYSVTFADHGRTGFGGFNIGNEDFGTAHDVGISFAITSGLATPVPEPVTWAMLYAGFGLIGVAIRYRKAVSAAFA
jgi:hypothetical protein